mmetsp:Transcript_38697/g.90509  ORF Transcript_38697/g.90509 Transcript_38697/m.90509 type:complete len:209 (-) Transcript_38697:2696-3322(-)
MARLPHPPGHLAYRASGRALLRALARSGARGSQPGPVRPAPCCGARGAAEPQRRQRRHRPTPACQCRRPADVSRAERARQPGPPLAGPGHRPQPQGECRPLWLAAVRLAPRTLSGGCAASPGLGRIILGAEPREVARLVRQRRSVPALAAMRGRRAGATRGGSAARHTEVRRHRARSAARCGSGGAPRPFSQHVADPAALRQGPAGRH